MSSITLKHCDFIIRYENIEEDYIIALRKIGITNPRPLPIANKTYKKRKELLDYYSSDLKKQAMYIFGPFFQKHYYHFPKEWEDGKISIYSKIQFFIYSLARRYKSLFLKKRYSRKSIKGSIYGDMQRQKGKDGLFKRVSKKK